MYAIVSALLLSSLALGPAFAAEAPADAGSKPPAIDFNLEVLSPMKKPFFTCKADQAGIPAAHCDENTLRWVAYGALSVASEARSPGSAPTPQDFKNQVLGEKIGASTAPIDLTVDEKSALKAALYRVYNPGVAYAACRVFMSSAECGS